MFHPRYRDSSIRCSIVLAMLLFLSCGGVDAADPGKIKTAILKSQQHILQSNLAEGTGTFAAYAYIKSGGDKKATLVQKMTSGVLSKFDAAGKYRPAGNHNYEASVDLMLLEAVDAEAYRPRMEAIVAYLLYNQQPNGAWFYDRQIEADCGDVSITQYVMMGLWAAMRAEIEVPVEVWERAAKWHLEKQREDGGFCYHPFNRTLSINPEYHRTTDTMTAAGTSSMLIIRYVLFEGADPDPEVRPADAKRRFGVLERFVDERPAGQKRTLNGVPTLRVAALDKGIKESTRWMGAHFGEQNANHQQWFAYHLYTIERVAALLDVVKIGSHDWYNEGADELLQRQAVDGSWTDNSSTLASTAMGLMFLSKATTTVVIPKKRISLVGGGLQKGGRGLPDKLDAVLVKEGDVTARKIVGPVDTLLLDLEKSADAKVETAQAAIVEAVQLDYPEELIGQTPRLQKLAGDTRLEVRRTALWALGRSGDLPSAKWLIKGLSDPEPTVAREASLGLCILSRRPEGCGQPIDPLDDTSMGLSEDATEPERFKRLDEWKRESTKRWTDWYQKNRPYGERDDRTTLKQNNK